MASPSGVIDLRSDTVTTPTPEMRRAMADAEVGDDGYREDPTVNRLETLAAALLGKEAALYVPSGTMANQLALRLLGRPGTEVLCGERAHVYRYENAASAGERRCAAAPVARRRRPARSRRDRARAASQPHHLPEISAVTIENTHMPACGRPWRVGEVDAVVDAASAHGFAVHCDGARIWNAAVALDVAPTELVAAPTPSCSACRRVSRRRWARCCAAPRDAIAEARASDRSRLGGGMRQAGVIAAAGIVALETMVDRLRDDHARAHALAVALADRFSGCVDPDHVETNIVCAPADRLPRDPARRSRPRASAPAPSTPTPCASSPTRTSTTPTSTGRSRPSTTSRARAGAPTTDRYARSVADDIPRVRSRSTRTPTTPRSRPAARSRAGPTGARRSGC